MRMRVTIGMVAALMAFGVPTAGASSAVSGRWITTIPCLGMTPPIWGAFHCSGESSWRGTWTGSTTYTADGAVNAKTGDAHGTVDEVFRGRAPDGRTGTLRLDEHFVVDGSTHRVHRRFKVMETTGHFAGMRGWGSFDGTVAGPVASGTYRGRWKRRRSR